MFGSHNLSFIKHYKRVVCSEVLAGVVNGAPGRLVCRGGVCVSVDDQWHTVGVAAPMFCGASSWCRGLFSGSSIQVCLVVSVGERQKICKEVGGCVACYL